MAESLQRSLFLFIYELHSFFSSFPPANFLHDMYRLATASVVTTPMLCTEPCVLCLVSWCLFYFPKKQKTKKKLRIFSFSMKVHIFQFCRIYWLCERGAHWRAVRNAAARAAEDCVWCRCKLIWMYLYFRIVFWYLYCVDINHLFF